MVVCQCGHYPVTRVVWTQGHKRSTDVEEDSRGVTEATILNIVVGNIEGRVKKVKMFLTLVGQDITMARKEFDKEAPSYHWTTKAPFVGSGSYNVTICADLGPGYYRAGTITSTVFSTWALQCLHWFDANNGWDDSFCKAHEDTVSGMVVCQCGHYPVTRVVWTQGHKRSTGEFTRAPSLLASKLLVFPNKLDYNEAKISTITSTVFSASTLQCLYWLDANNGWEDSLSKAQEDTVSGRIMCKCEHFPNRRIV
ncbi:unnamed protein product [Clavelina lepadiformis]|uniref:Uncharacterized protein n=2 Tax=Clavelina lepadiformis TaxID=159417 RepID=A0ABP0GC24_CLALP